MSMPHPASEVPAGIEVLTLMQPSPLLAPQLDATFQLHLRLHDTDPAAFAAVAPRIRGIAAEGGSKLPEALLALLPALEIVSVMGVGYDGIPVAACKARGVMVTHTPDVLNDDVADLALGLMLSTARQLPAADRWVREGRWAREGNPPLARKLSGARVGIVGMGRIGQAIAQRALAFNMRIAYTARSAKADLPYTFVPDVVSLAGQSDWLVVITPGGAGTRHLINGAVLAALGSSSADKGVLINVARGSVVDEAALVHALAHGVIGGAGLDVFEQEPQVPDALRAMAHVVLTPHIGSATQGTRQAMADLAFHNLAAHFAGQPVHTPVPECR